MIQATTSLSVPLLPNISVLYLPQLRSFLFNGTSIYIIRFTFITCSAEGHSCLVWEMGMYRKAIGMTIYRTQSSLRDSQKQTEA
jgi:hypothetical protein